VCNVLGLTNPTKALYGLDDDEKMNLTIGKGHSRGRGGAQFQNLVNESGLYSLIFQSRKPEAHAFRKWVTSELLPVVRKTGKYAPSKVENDCPYTQPDLLLPEQPAYCQATPEWLLNMMNDVCCVEDTELRRRIVSKLMAVSRI
jgi:prophage antirepressor-like protein